MLRLTTTVAAIALGASAALAAGHSPELPFAVD